MAENVADAGSYLQGSTVVFKDKKAVARTLLAVFLAPWVIDVRSLSGMEWLVVVQLASFLFSTVILVLSFRILKQRNVGLGLFAGNGLNVAVCAAFAGVGMLSGFAGQNDLFKVFAFTIPTVLFIYSLLLISAIAQTGLKPEDIFDVVITVAIIAVLLRIPIIATLFGIDLRTARYQIMCGATTVGIAYIVARAAAGYRPPDIAFAVLQAAIIVVSVTRTEIGTVLVLGFIFVVAGFRRLINLKTVLIAGAALPLFFLAVYAMISALPGNQVARWTIRTSSFQAGTADLSGLERESQIIYQVQKLDAADSTGKLIGFGIAAPGGNYAPFEALEASKGFVGMYTPVGFADHTYVSLLFLAGLLGGGPLLFAQILWFRNAFRAISYITRTYPRQLTWLAAAPLTVISFQFSNIVAASFADRQASVFFGVCLGITSWLMAIQRRDARAAKSRPFEPVAPLLDGP
jgi:hypothetical protein